MSKHGSSNACAATPDITKLSLIPGFAASIARDHPDLDCVVLNSGGQRAFDFSKLDTADLHTFGGELTTNYTAFVHQVTAFLPQLQKQGKEKETNMVFVGASLGLVPGMTRTPGYNASKAALHSWVTTLRQQLKGAGDQVRVVEVFPPAVQIELHEEKYQPDLQNGGEIGMPLDQFAEAMYAQLEKGDDQFAIGPAHEWLENGFEAERQKIFQHQQSAIKAALAKYFK